MEYWTQEQLCFLQGLTDEKTIMRTAIDLIKQLDFEYLTFSAHPRIFITPARVTALTNLPPRWVERYQSMNYVSVDPMVAHCYRSIAPLHWTDEVFNRSPIFRDDAYAHGIRHGVSQCSHDHRGNISMLSLVRQHAPVGSEEFHDKAGHVIWLCNALHTLLADSLLHNLDDQVPLSSREVEVLRWSAEGKTSADVAIILSVAERTVNYHVYNAIRKLNATNKTSAVVLAAMSGYL